MDKSLRFDYKVCRFQGDFEDGSIKPRLRGLSSKVGVIGKSVILFSDLSGLIEL